MEQKIFTAMELDAIGEVMNISLGSSATAISNMLNHRVDISTPTVDVVNSIDFHIEEVDPAVGVEIEYVSGLSGSNIMLLKREDVRVIVNILMGTEFPDEEFEINDLTVSAVCEVMNQMMGASATALSEFFGKATNISTPKHYYEDQLDQLKEKLVIDPEEVLAVRFTITIEDKLKSDFLNIMSLELARDLLDGFGMAFGSEEPAKELEKAPEPVVQEASGGKLSQEEIERMLGGMGVSTSEPEPEPTQAPPPSSPPPQAQMPDPNYGAPPQGMPPQGYNPYGMPPQGYDPYYGMPPQGYPQYPPQGYAPPQPMQPAEPKVINTRQVNLPSFDLGDKLTKEQADNLDLIMSVPLEVSVEIGRTKRKVEDILTFSKGTLVVLDKLAGDQVDLFVNGLCVARGDVVVIEDNFGVRITEVLKNNQIADLLKNNK